MDDVALNKAATIERCLRRVREEYADRPENLQDITKQDAIVLNIQRACEAAIDLAMHLVRVRKLGLPQESRDAFELLEGASVITKEDAAALKRMVGFRSVAVHDYQKLNLAIVEAIVRDHLGELERFALVGVSHSNTR